MEITGTTGTLEQTGTNPLLRAAKYWVGAGVAVIPIQYRDKRPAGNLLPKDDKGNATWEPFKTRLPTNDELLKWFPSSLHNIGIVTGWKNLVVVDFDSMGAYAQWATWTARIESPSAKWAAEHTYMVRTARGVHLYFRTVQPEQNRKLNEIDIKARGGYVLGVPSVHPSGALYRQIGPSSTPAVIEALSEVLPAQLLVQNTVLPPGMAMPVKAPYKILSADPWSVALNVSDPDKDLITQLRSTYQIEQFFPNAEETGGSRWLMDICPFHDDSHPSFWIDAQRQICGCFSGCTYKPLDVINLYARLHGLTNRDAIFYMAHGV